MKSEMYKMKVRLVAKENIERKSRAIWVMTCRLFARLNNEEIDRKVELYNTTGKYI